MNEYFFLGGGGGMNDDDLPAINKQQANIPRRNGSDVDLPSNSPFSVFLIMFSSVSREWV